MRTDLPDVAGTGFRYEYDDASDLVEISTHDGDCLIAEVSLEVADRWRHGRARFFRASGFEETVTADALADPDATAASDQRFLDGIGIGIEVE